jgi:hypothetical protein
MNTKQYRAAVDRLVDLLVSEDPMKMNERVYKLEDDIWKSIELRHPQCFREYCKLTWGTRRTA